MLLFIFFPPFFSFWIGSLIWCHELSFEWVCICSLNHPAHIILPLHVIPVQYGTQDTKHAEPLSPLQLVYMTRWRPRGQGCVKALKDACVGVSACVYMCVCVTFWGSGFLSLCAHVGVRGCWGKSLHCPALLTQLFLCCGGEPNTESWSARSAANILMFE